VEVDIPDVWPFNTVVNTGNRGPFRRKRFFTSVVLDVDLRARRIELRLIGIMNGDNLIENQDISAGEVILMSWDEAHLLFL